jgi:hypothetical protein
MTALSLLEVARNRRWPEHNNESVCNTAYVAVLFIRLVNIPCLLSLIY